MENGDEICGGRLYFRPAGAWGGEEGLVDDRRLTPTATKLMAPSGQAEKEPAGRRRYGMADGEGGSTKYEEKRILDSCFPFRALRFATCRRNDKRTVRCRRYGLGWQNHKRDACATFVGEWLAGGGVESGEKFTNNLTKSRVGLSYREGRDDVS